MGYKTRVQVIRRKSSRQWYVGLPSALAEALELEKGELIEWRIEDRKRILLIRSESRPGTSRTRPRNNPRDRVTRR